MGIDWNHELADQLDWQWGAQMRPRYEGLTDEEYFWEPVADTWSIRPRGQGRTETEWGGGAFIMDGAHPAPDPPPVTTIAWRLAHLIVGTFGARVAGHFDGPPVDPGTFEYAGTAAGACVNWMTSTPPGCTVCTASGKTGLPALAAPPKALSPTTPWRRWSCTSTVRRCTTVPR
jgi:hypothetical protein